MRVAGVNEHQYIDWSWSRLGSTVSSSDSTSSSNNLSNSFKQTRGATLMQNAFELPDHEWVDVSAEFESALAELSMGQLIQHDAYSMMDLMSAIEINDPRTDSYVSARNAQVVDQDELDEFDPSRQLDSREVLWIIDEIARSEATFQDGQPLMSTLWNCNYFRTPSLAAISSTCPSPTAVDSLQSVFRAMLLGILKSNEIVWEECCKGQVYEHEDVHLASSTLSFNNLMAACFPPSSPSPPASPNPLLVAGQQSEPSTTEPTTRSVSIDDVLRLLDGCLAWLQSKDATETVDRATLDELTLRVTLRIDLLYMLALLTFPAHTSPSQIRNHLNRIKSYESKLPSPSSTASTSLPPFDPPAYLLSIFTASRSIPLLATSQPPRHIESLPVGESYDRLARELVKELGGLCDLWEGWRDEKMGWKEVREYGRMMARRAVSPYLRSLHQTVMTSTPSHVFSVSPLIHFATSFLTTLTPIPASFFLEDLYELHQTETSYSSPAHLVFAWLERLSQELIRMSLPLAGQNRPRQYRWIRKSCLPPDSTWSQFLEDTRSIIPVLSSISAQQKDSDGITNGIRQLETVVRSFFLELVLESVCSGFEEEMQLYEEDERSRVWFVVSRLAGELEGVWSGLEKAKGGNEGYLKAKLGEVRGIKEMARGSLIMTLLFSKPEPKFSSPFLPSVHIDPKKADRGRYQQRFDWIGGAGLENDIVTSQVRYEDYLAELESLQGLGRDSLVREGKSSFEQAINSLTSMASVPLIDRGSSVRPELALRTLASLRRTAYANQNQLISTKTHDASEQQPPIFTFKWDHPWFPIWHASP